MRTGYEDNLVLIGNNLDWVQDAAWEQLRRRARKDEVADLERKGLFGFRGKVRDTYDAAQGWILVSLLGR